MLIGKLEQHCGECGVIDYCGNAFGYCLCTDARFKFVDEAEYKNIAEKAPSYEDVGKQGFEPCRNCSGENCDECDNNDENRDYVCNHIADFVWQQLKIKLESLICDNPAIVGVAVFQRWKERDDND